MNLLKIGHYQLVLSHLRLQQMGLEHHILTQSHLIVPLLLLLRKNIFQAKIMFNISHNYMLGLAVLIFAFIFFYVPMVYAFLSIRKQQRKQNKL